MRKSDNYMCKKSSIFITKYLQTFNLFTHTYVFICTLIFIQVIINIKLYQYKRASLYAFNLMYIDFFIHVTTIHTVYLYLSCLSSGLNSNTDL